MILRTNRMNRTTDRQTNRRETGQRRKRWLWLTLLSAAACVAIAYLLLTQFKSQVKTIVYDSINGYTDLHNVTTGDIEAYIGQQKMSQTTAANANPAISGPLTVHPANPRYFVDGNGQIVYLTGSHYWLNLQDGVLTDPPPAFDYSTYLDFLEAHNHNFFRLWTWEQSKWVVEWASPYYFAPTPYSRPGPGNALDGKPKYDLTQFNQVYFDRLRERVIEAGIAACMSP